MATETAEIGVETLREKLKGDLVTPEDEPVYDDARRVWNGRINKSGDGRSVRGRR